MGFLNREMRFQKQGLSWDELTEEEKKEFHTVIKTFGEEEEEYYTYKAVFFKEGKNRIGRFTSPEGKIKEISVTCMDAKEFKNIMGSFEKKGEERDNKNPSEVNDSYWIYARNKGNKHYQAYGESGKWLIFADKGPQLDSIWKRVKELTEKGLLVDDCKVSTNKENPNARDMGRGVICVYTYDVNDKEDLRRVAEILFTVNGVDFIIYKTDNATKDGKYVVKGDKKISSYAVTKNNYKEKLA